VRIVVQRVSRAEVRVQGAVVGAIGRGLLLLVAVERGDGLADLDWFADKVLQMRVFDDNAGKMNLSALEIGAEILVVSQFTLVGDLSRGRRPGFERAAPPQEAATLFSGLVDRLSNRSLRVATGRFREFMEVELVNDGPVTILLDGKGR
jgi:D-aminoacyl-tRNA deacylase